MFEYFVPVVKLFMLLPGIVTHITRRFAKFPGRIAFMVLDFMFQLIDVFKLDVNLVIILFNLGHGLTAKGFGYHVMKPFPELG